MKKYLLLLLLVNFISCASENYESPQLYVVKQYSNGVLIGEWKTMTVDIGWLGNSCSFYEYDSNKHITIKGEFQITR